MDDRQTILRVALLQQRGEIRIELDRDDLRSTVDQAGRQHAGARAHLYHDLVSDDAQPLDDSPRDAAVLQKVLTQPLTGAKAALTEDMGRRLARSGVRHRLLCGPPGLQDSLYDDTLRVYPVRSARDQRNRGLWGGRQDAGIRRINRGLACHNIRVEDMLRV